MRRRRIGASAGLGVVGSLIIMGLGAAIALMSSGSDVATFGWLLVVVGSLALVANLFVGARMQ
jgi:hypothetical protein